MSAKRYKDALSPSAQKIRKALRAMSKTRQIELMVEAGVMTQEQADRARKNLAESEPKS